MLLLVDALALFDAFALGYLFRFHWDFVLPRYATYADVDHYMGAWGLAGAFVVFLFHAYGLYDPHRVRAPIDVLPPLLRAGGGAVLLVLGASYFYREFDYSRVALVYSAGFALLLMGAHRIAFESYRARERANGHGLRRAILVGSRTLPQFIAKRFASDRGCGYELVAAIDRDVITEPCFAELPTGCYEDLARLIAETNAHEVLIAHSAVGHHEMLALIEVCERQGIPIRTVPATYDLVIDSGDFVEVGGIPLVTVNETRTRRAHRLVKRVMDVALSLLGLILLAPVFAAIAIAIKLDSRGAALFRQKRIGKDGSPFFMCKFRTMTADAESLVTTLVDLDRLDEPVYKIANDPRVTRVGRVLRRTSLDELPQLWNVLRGQMSLVGPRPEEARVVERYDVWERRRLKLVPGITGLQQIHCRGGNSLKERVHWDILYLRKESIVLDLWILLRTVGAVISGRGAT